LAASNPPHLPIPSFDLAHAEFGGTPPHKVCDQATE
jgi:hypothetical protein